MTDYRNLILSFMKKHLQSGMEEDARVILIGRSPHIAPEAITHKLFTGLNEKELNTLENAIQRPIPEGLKAFYRQCNGFRCFIDQFQVSGLRTSNARDIKTARSQPFNLVNPNVQERPQGADDDMVFFGSYSYDGSRVYTRSDNKIYYSERYAAKPIKEWENLYTFLSQELERIFSLFSDRAELMVDNKMVLPVY